jgi:hypothetical protein
MERGVCLNTIGTTSNRERPQHIEGLSVEYRNGCANRVIVALVCYINASCSGMKGNAFRVWRNGGVYNHMIGLAIQDIQFSAG